jgi:hypothetical protein
MVAREAWTTRDRVKGPVLRINAGFRSSAGQREPFGISTDRSALCGCCKVYGLRSMIDPPRTVAFSIGVA